MKLGHELHKTLHELMGWYGPMTHRQFTVWQAWLSMEMSQPSKSDYYAMQIALYVARSSAKHPNSITFDKMRLKFKDPESQSNVSPEEMNARVIATSLSRLGAVKLRLPDGTPITKKEIIEMTLRGNKPKIEEEVNPDVVVE